MERFNLNENQVESILNIRLRCLRKLQEIEICQEFEALQNEQKKTLENLMESIKLQWKNIRQQIEKLRKAFGNQTVLGQRKTTLSPLQILLFHL